MTVRARATSLLLAVLALPLSAAALHAQACLGYPSFSRNHLQMNADFIANDDFEELGASFVAGSNTAFGGLGVNRTLYDLGDVVAIRGSLGYQVPVSKSGRVQACPQLRVNYGLPTDVSFGGELSVRSYGFALGVGGELFKAQRVAIVPSVQLGLQRDEFTYSALGADDIEDTYVYAGLNVGIVLNEQLSIRPSLHFPDRGRLREPIFGLGLALNFGGRR